MLKMINVVKKAGTASSLWLVSAYVFADSSGDDQIDVFQFVKNILTQDLQPLLSITFTVTYLIGLCLIIAGLTRLYRHGHGAHSMMHRVSPMSTGMCFLAGFTLITLMSQIQMLSNSLYPLDQESVLAHSCTSAVVPVGGSDFTTSSNDFCPMEAYSNDVPDPSDDNRAEVGEAIKYMMFGVLFLVGMISFARGTVQLVKIGEGGGGQHSVGRALTHIFAGIVAVNPDLFYGLMQNVLNSNTGSS